MKEIFNLYVDESCHLEHDGYSSMTIGYSKIPNNSYAEIKSDIKQIKLKHKSPTELKWNKLSYSRIGLYKDLIDYFFESDIKFRCVLIKNKHNINNDKFNLGDHNAFYYKVVYLLLYNRYVNNKESDYRAFLDIKDTNGRVRLNTLEEVIKNKFSNRSPFIHFQNIRSHENELIQLTDLFIGAIAYKARGLHKGVNSSRVKKELIEYLEEKSGYLIDEGTEPWEDKFNIFDFQISSAR